jgi:hypothetical protein
MTVTVPSQPAPVFVVAAPRSGGQRLARWLSGPKRPINHWLGIIDAARAARGLPMLDKSDMWTRDDALVWSPWLQPVLDQQSPGVAPTVDAFEFAPATMLRVAALAHWLPKARFVFLYRDVRETLALMLDSWMASRHPHASGVQLPSAQRWNFPLPPGWSTQCNKPLIEIVAWQWAMMMRVGLDMLADLEPERWCVTSYDRLLQDPFCEMRGIAQFLDCAPCPQESAGRRFLPAGRTSPDAALWRAHADLLKVAAPIVALQADRAVRLFATSPQTRVAAMCGE